MATAFAITGIHRSRLKYYRPSYHSELPPIYEDPTTLLRHDLANSRREEYTCSPSLGKVGNGNAGFVHNYEEINAANMDNTNRNRPIANPSETSVTMLNGIMNSISRFKANGNAKSKTDGYHTEHVYKLSTGTMLNGIMNNRLNTRNTLTHDSKHTLKEQNNNNKHEEKNRFRDPELQLYTKDAFPVLEELDKTLELHDDDQLANEEAMVSRTERNSLSSLYQENDGGRTLEYGVITDDNGFAVKRWPKLEPEPPKTKHLLCPAERKMRRRCFIVCFVVLVLLIVFLVTGMIEGWMYTKDGTGFGGSEKTILMYPPFRNATDVEN